MEMQTKRRRKSNSFDFYIIEKSFFQTSQDKKL